MVNLNSNGNAFAVGDISPSLEMPLTGIQSYVWFHQRMDPSATPYNIGNLLHIQGSLDVKTFTLAHNLMLKQTDCLRIRFAEVDNVPFQSIAPFAEQAIQVWDFRESPSPNSEGQRLLHSIEKTPFELIGEPLYRFGLIRTANDQWIFFTFFHHLIIDAVGGSKLFADLQHIFLTISENRNEELQQEHSLSWMYAAQDFQHYRISEQWNLDRKFWADKLLNLGKAATLSKKTLKKVDLSLPGSVFIELSRENSDSICKWGVNSGRSAYSGFATAAIIYLAKMLNLRDICIGAPNAGRNKLTRNLIGMLANATPLRVQIDETDSVGDILSKTSKELRSGLRHTQYPYGEITQDRRKINLDPPFLMIVNYLALDQVVHFGDAVGVVETWGAGPVADMEIHIFDRMDQGPVQIRLDFNQDRYSSQEVQLHLQRFAGLLVRLPDSSDIKFQDIEVISSDEKSSILEFSRGPYDDFAHEGLLITDLFARSAAHNTEKPALLYMQGEKQLSMSYGELDRRSNQLAHYLISQGVGPEQIVGILLNRSPELIISILAILKAGGAYLPIDPVYPLERINFMLMDSSVSTVITNIELDNTLGRHFKRPGYRSILLDSDILLLDLETKLKSSSLGNSEQTFLLSNLNLAYIIYTSGSTGVPKAVCVPHVGVINTAAAKVNVLGISDESRVLQFASHAFDGSVQEIFSTFLAGATLVLPPTGIGMDSAAYLEEHLKQFSVTHVTLPPALVSLIKDSALLGLETLVVAGEDCPPQLVKRFASSIKMINAYGPTEVSICAAMSNPLSNASNASLDAVTIGGPISNVYDYVLDDNLNLVPIGMVGELYIGGIGVTRGYLNKPGLTAERFLACPYGPPGSRMYRSGDLVKRSNDGNLIYVGRADDQIKLRGFRVETGEIESQLVKRFPEFNQVSVALKSDDSGTHLVAYLVANQSINKIDLPTVEKIRTTLNEFLPNYMVPSFYEYLESMPIGANGKIDKKSLPDPITKVRQSDFQPPDSDVEKRLCRLFSELIGVENIGVNDDFFLIGGHSLLAIKLISRFRDETGLVIPLDQLFENATPKAIAALVQLQKTTHQPETTALVRGMGRVR